MITEIIRFNCHVLKVNKYNKITPDELLLEYKTRNNLILENTEVYVESCKWAAGSTSTIITKVKRIEK